MTARAELRAAFMAALVKETPELLGVDWAALRALPKAERIAAIRALLKP